MELQEDADILKQILTNVSREEIVVFLRTNVPFSDSDDRCRLALQHFLRLENEKIRSSASYDPDFRADFVCLKRLLRDVPNAEIRNVLHALGSIPNRKLVAVNILLHYDRHCNCRNTKKLRTSTDATSSGKLVNVTYPADAIEFDEYETEQYVIPAQATSARQYPPQRTASPIVSNETKTENRRNSAGPSDAFHNGEARPADLPRPSAELMDSDWRVLLDSMQKELEKLDKTKPGEADAAGPLEDARPGDEKLVQQVLEIFPEAPPEHIRNICEGRDEESFVEIVNLILANGVSPKKPEPAKVDCGEQLDTLRALLPDADPAFLQAKLHELAGDQLGLMNFVENAMDKRNYPTMMECSRQQQLSAQQKQYTTEFDVERFLELFPDPVAVFEDPEKKTTIIDKSDKDYVRWFMTNKYNQVHIFVVNNIIEMYGPINVVSIVNALDKCPSHEGPNNMWFPNLDLHSQNIPLLQELAYFEHKNQILAHLEAKKTSAAQERKIAKDLELLQTCSCCFDEEVMPCDICTCTGGCRFCRDCVKCSTEVAFSEGRVNFPCLSGECDAEFSLPVLQSVLPPKLFSKLAQKKTMAEVKAAGLEDLEECPFCDFVNIPAPEDKLFHCLNPECMKESCRLCKESSHVPLRCEEVEKDEAVKARTYIETKMSQALIRECWKCGAKFIKEEGCNKMNCACGAMMCYICRKPVQDYAHFNRQGGHRTDLCPLYSDDIILDENNVLKAAEQAKNEVDATQLKNDPTADLQKHFDRVKEARKQGQRPPALPPRFGRLGVGQYYFQPPNVFDHHQQYWRGVPAGPINQRDRFVPLPRATCFPHVMGHHGNNVLPFRQNADERGVNFFHFHNRQPPIYRPNN